MTSRSFKPSSLTLRPRRPSMARTSSNSSTKSQDLPSPLSTIVIAESLLDPRPKGAGQIKPPDIQRIARSRPIAIELPSRRRSGQTNTPTPPEPLSARGDLLGGYFPLHEEIQRSYKTHPFDNYTSSKNNLATSIMPASLPAQYTPTGHVIVDQPQKPRAAPVADPLLSQMPLGKYHPSLFKQVKIPEKLAAKAVASQGPTQQQTQSKHHRKNSDIKRKVQQYQRDMVEQAALAGRMQIPGTKPISPRLLPLNSPGPVTPMELEERTEYMTLAANDEAELGSDGRSKERRASS